MGKIQRLIGMLALSESIVFSANALSRLQALMQWQSIVKMNISKIYLGNKMCNIFHLF